MRRALIAVLAAAVLLTSCTDTPHMAKQAVMAKLKDPGSVQWRDLTYDGRDNVCGYFNAKNSFGGYAGFKRFRYLLGQVWIEGDPGTYDSTFGDCPKGQQSDPSHL